LQKDKDWLKKKPVTKEPERRNRNDEDEASTEEID
jgi:hypothetical protein